MESAPRPDLELVAIALEDHSSAADWWLDVATGEVVRIGESEDDAELLPADPGAAGWLRIAPGDGRLGYRDMEDFIATLAHSAARDGLARAIQGRGAFRRFKDVLQRSCPDDVPAWNEFKSARARERAVAWLEDRGLAAPGARASAPPGP